MLIGIDYGGTKIEGLIMSPDGKELLRLRVPTPRGDYQGSLDAVASLVRRLEAETGQRGSTVGIGLPGSISPQTGFGRNGNATWLFGHPLEQDFTAACGLPVRVANDGNCLALSEAMDGAGKGLPSVFAVILGTGVGGGIVIDGKIVAGANGVASEWGHIPLPPAPHDHGPVPKPCFCGRPYCTEAYLAGPAIEADYARESGAEPVPLKTVHERFLAGEPAAVTVLDRHLERLARGLGTIVNLLDPDIFVLGGGVTNMPHIVERLPQAIAPHVLMGEGDTPLIRVARAMHGDSSGVRGAARLWDMGR